MSTAAPSRLSRKRLRPEKREGEHQHADRQHRRLQEPNAGGSNASVARTKVRTLIPGSSNAATNVVTDCGALKNDSLVGIVEHQASAESLLRGVTAGDGRAAARGERAHGKLAQTTCS